MLAYETNGETLIEAEKINSARKLYSKSTASADVNQEPEVLHDVSTSYILRIHRG